MVSCGTSHTIVLTNHRTNQPFNAYAFGSGIYGQLGTGSNRNHSNPMRVNLKNVEQISAGENHSLFIQQGILFGCGDNSLFQIGNTINSEKQKKYMLEITKYLIIHIEFQYPQISYSLL